MLSFVRINLTTPLTMQKTKRPELVYMLYLRILVFRRDTHWHKCEQKLEKYNEVVAVRDRDTENEIDFLEEYIRESFYYFSYSCIIYGYCRSYEI